MLVVSLSGSFIISYISSWHYWLEIKPDLKIFCVCCNHKWSKSICMYLNFVKCSWNVTMCGSYANSVGLCCSYLRQQGGCYVIVLSVSHSVNRITDERRNGRRPNLAGMHKGCPSRTDYLLMVIQICMWIPHHFFIFFTLQKVDFGHLLAFLIQSTADFYHAWQNHWRRQDNASTTFWDRSDKHQDPD